jgi:hypothetical protein
VAWLGLTEQGRYLLALARKTIRPGAAWSDVYRVQMWYGPACPQPHLFRRVVCLGSARTPL